MEKSQTPAGKISIGLQLVGDQKSFPWVSEIFLSCPLTGFISFMSFCSFSFSHCIVSLRFMASDYPYVIFKPLLILLCRGRDRMVVGFKITYAITTTVVSLNPAHVLHTISLSLAAGQWFSADSSTNKTDRHEITEILLKVA